MRQGDREITWFRSHNGAALLAYLAYHLGRPHPREVLAELLWPWAPPGSGRANLRVELAALRRQLEPPGVPAGSVVSASRSHIELTPQAVSTDVRDFECALAEAGKAETEAARVALTAEALALYTGSLLPGHYHDWVVAEQDRLAELHFQAADSLVQMLESAGNTSAAIHHARRAIAADPMREDCHLRIMRLLARAGRFGAVHRQYRELKRVLQDELGTSPSTALQRWIDGLPGPPMPPTPATTRGERSRPAPLTGGRPRNAPEGTVTLLLCDADRPDGDGVHAEPAGRGGTCCQALREEARRCGGAIVQALPDGLVAAFSRASDALTCAVAGQHAIAERVRSGLLAASAVRMALHTSEVVGGEDDPYGEVIRHGSQLLAAAHPGQILCSTTTRVMLSRHHDPEVMLIDLGSYRLGLTDECESVFQASYPGMGPQEFPQLRAEASHGALLPLALTTFVGRDDELGWLRRTLTDTGVRLVTVTGPGGAGKTRLVLEAARSLIDEFRGAVWFAPLGELRDVEALPGAVTDALRLPRTGHRPPLERAAERLGRQSSLLVLDNMEQILPDAAPVVGGLLEQAPQLTCVITSRRRVGLDGEVELRVPPLAVPEDGESPLELARSPAVRLFLDRAQAARPDFQLTAGNATVVAEICRRLEGLPLAIELAAAWAQVLTPTQMAAQLQDRLTFLVSRRDADERHRALRATVDWSCHLLSPRHRDLFAKLSVFRGGWTLEAAEAVCEDADALEAMLHLSESSIVHSREHVERMRYDMLETFREFAAELLPAEAAEALRARHAAYFASLAEQRAAEADAPDEAAAFGELEAELGNLGAAVDWSIASGADPVTARLAAALGDFLWRHGHWEEHGRLVGAGLRAFERSLRDETALGGRLLHSLARVAYDRGDLHRAERDCERGIQLVLEGAAVDWHGMLVNMLGLIALRRQQHAKAERLLDESLVLLRAAGHPRGEGIVLHNLGMLAAATGHSDRSRVLHEQALVIQEACGDVRGVAETRNNLGVLAYESGDLPEAERMYRESLRSIVALGDVLWLAVSLCNLGELALRDGRPQEAVRLLAPAERALRHLGSVHASAAADYLAEALCAGAVGVGADDPRWRETLIATAREASGA